jgi:PKD repeat protein
MKRIMKLSWALMLLLSVAFVSSCKDDESEPEVIASFSYAVDAADFMKVTFTNESKEFKSLSWDFGDASALSTETNPVHTYAALGEYTVKLTATSPGGVTDMYSAKVTIADPNAALTILVGEGAAGKTWKLLRDVSGGVFPLEVGPAAHNEIWWAMGRDNNELGNRPCMLNDEFTFKRDGSLVIDRKGDYWAEGGIYIPANVCANTADPMVGAANENLSVWAGGTHAFTLDGANKKITATGVGAFIGFEKLGDGVEVSAGASATVPIVPPASITYDLISLYDGTTDTLIVQGLYNSGAGYWRFVLVHYDNPNDEPPIPGNKPNVAFSVAISGLTVTTTNTTVGATSYLWDFGDGQTSTEMNPVHTYAAGGPYSIKLTATNSTGDASSSQSVFVTNDVLTDALLQGAAWKVKVDNLTVFVGGGMGWSNWWSVPVNFLNGGAAGTTDDWSCMADDEFIFGAGGVYSYKTNGSARNDGYFGGTNGCIDDAGIAASGNGAAFGTCLDHTYTFTPGGKKGVKARPIITLTNAPGFAAFIGFYKGYYGGENTDASKAPNGGNATNIYEVMGYAKAGAKEYLFVTTDISDVHDGSRSWSAILER